MLIQGTWKRWLGLGMLALALLAGLAVAAIPRRAVDACPEGPRDVHPTAVHLAPHFLEHQNWIEISTRNLSAGREMVACVDGQVAGTLDIDAEDLQRGSVQIGIQTRWVDLQWLGGRLDAYRDPDRWVIVPESA